MNTSELRDVLKEHAAWLHSSGGKGQRAVGIWSQTGSG